MAAGGAAMNYPITGPAPTWCFLNRFLSPRCSRAEIPRSFSHSKTCKPRDSCISCGFWVELPLEKGRKISRSEQ